MNKLENILGPLSEKISTNKYISSLSTGMVATMPIMLGTSLIAIITNLPIPAWTTFLQNIGIYTIAQDFIAATLSLLAIYIVCTISYSFTKKEGKNPMTGLVLALASFLAMIPLHITIGEASVTAFSTANLGSNGIFFAMICGLLVPKLYCTLSDKNLKIKLPDSVPPMVSDSLEPTFVAMIIFTIVFFLKYAFSLTSYGDIFTAINALIAAPVMQLGSSPWSLIIFYCFANFCWFFGIHPGALISCYVPVIYAAKLANIDAFIAGDPLPYLAFSIVGMCVYVGGNGNTLGLCLSMFFAKSEKYKSLRKLVTLPNLFNINEPVIFGIPIMLNPIYFIPMVFSSFVAGTGALLLLNFITVDLNLTIAMPWVTPGFITAFMQGGYGFFIIWCTALLLHFLMYLPFFKIDDLREYKKEQMASIQQAE